MDSNTLLRWLSGYNAAQKGKVVGKIKGLGVAAFQGSVYLFYTTSIDADHVLLAKSSDGLMFVYADEVRFLPAHHADFLEQIRFYRQEKVLQAQYKVLSQSRWRATRTRDLISFLPDEETLLEEPIVELHDPERQNSVRYYGEHHLWIDGKMVLSPRRGSFDDGLLVPEACFKVEDGILLIYSARIGSLSHLSRKSTIAWHLLFRLR